MEVTLNALKIKKCIEPCNTLVGKLDKGFDLQYCNIQLLIENNNLTLFATDTNIFVKTVYGPIEGDPVPDLDVSIPADNFYTVVSDIVDPNDTITLSFKNKYVKITYKKQQFTLHYFYHAELIEDKVSLFDAPLAFKLYMNRIFVDMEQNTLVPLFSTPFSKFKHILNSLIPCMSKSPAESRLYGIYYDGNFYASNNVSFTGCYKVNLDFPEVPEKPEINHIFFQNGVIQYLLKISTSEEPINLSLRGSLVIASINGLQVAFKNNLVNFIPVHVLQTFIDTCDKKFTIVNRELSPLIKKAIPFSDTLNRCYGEILFKPNKEIKVSVTDQHKKSSTVDYASEFDDDELESEVSRGLNLDLMYASLQNITSDNVFLHYNSQELKPLIFINEEDTQFYYISPVIRSTN